MLASLAHSHGRDEFARFSYSECMWLTLASLAHSHGRDEAGRECVITYTKWLRAGAAHNMGNLWQCCNVDEKTSIQRSFPPSYLYLQYLPGRRDWV